MIRLNDGRAVRARRNGSVHVTIEDNTGQQHTIDVAKAMQLAEALHAGGNVRLGTNEGRVLALAGIYLGDASVDHRQRNPQRPTGPWAIEDHRERLAREILAAVKGS